MEAAFLVEKLRGCFKVQMRDDKCLKQNTGLKNRQLKKKKKKDIKTEANQRDFCH